MPGVGLLTFTEPVPSSSEVIIKYTIEIDGLAVYTETYDVKKLARELEKDEASVLRNWIRRIKCVVGCRRNHGFSSCLTRCLADGKCCQKGIESCRSVDQ